MGVATGWRHNGVATCELAAAKRVREREREKKSLAEYLLRPALLVRLDGSRVAQLQRDRHEPSAETRGAQLRLRLCLAARKLNAALAVFAAVSVGSDGVAALQDLYSLHED